MAWNIIHFTSAGKDLVALIVNGDGDYWDGNSWEAGEQRLALVETDGEYLYEVTGMSDEGLVRVSVLDEGDADNRVGGGEAYIVGGAELVPATSAQAVAIQGATFDTATDSLEAIRNNMAAAAAGVTITPVLSTVSSGEVASSDITVYQGETKPFTFVLVDSEGAAINESGDTLVLVVRHLTTGAAIFQASGTVGGASNNQITVTIDDQYTASTATYRYELWNTTDDVVRARGAFSIVLAGQPT